MKKTSESYDTVFSTELATLGLRFAGSKLVKVKYLDNRQSVKSSAKSLSKTATEVKNKIERYLDPSSKIKHINIDVQLDVTPFQAKVLQLLQAIPYGETRTYGEIAKILKTSPRAVGNACRNNPLPIVIPCHRVTAVKGLGGYDGAKSGRLLAIKCKLLEKEGVNLSQVKRGLV